MTKIELKEAIDERVNEFIFPDGYVISTRHIYEYATIPHPSSATFENGLEYTLIGLPHFCAWGQAFVDAERNGDQTTQELALDQLQNVTLNIPTLHNMTGRFTEIFQAASLGDSSDLRNMVNVNCNWDVFEATPTAHILPRQRTRVWSI